MKKSEIDRIYIEGFIKSMEEDIDKWWLYKSSGIDGTIYEYKSPKYDDRISYISYKFGGGDGVYIDGYFKWKVPLSILLNPFNPYFWKYRKLRSRVKKYILEKEKQKELNYLYESARKG